MRQYGGMPVWGLAAVAGVVLAGAAWAVTSMPQQVSVDPNRTPRPIPTLAVAGSDTPLLGILGDSFVVGVGAENNIGWPMRADELLDSFRFRSNGITGSGFVNPGQGQPFGDRVSSVLDEDPDFLLIQASLNDTAFSDEEVSEAANDLLDEVQGTSPDLPVAVVGPIWLWEEEQPDIVRLRSVIENVADERGVTYIDPTGWITDDTAPELIGEDEIHPTSAGYQLIAERMAEAITATFG